MHRHHLYPLLIAFGMATAAQAQTDRPTTIRLSSAGTPSAFEVAGLPAADLEKLAQANLSADQWAALFAVYVAGDKSLPAMLGTYRIEKGVLRFEPRFPLSRGVRYRAVFRPKQLPGRGDAEDVVAEFHLPKPEQPAAVVRQVYPTRATLPENQLKFYVHFSAPMRRGDAYKYVRLLDAAGKAIDTPFLELGEELWNPECTRFTLFIDPGRIKRGLKPREDLGPVLEAGKTYTLVVDAAWEDAQGQPLKAPYRKAFRAVAEDDEPIDPKAWKIQPPAAGTAQPLTVTFPEPLDHALLHRLLTVVDAKGQQLAGSVAVTDDETRWHFTPERPWQAGPNRLVVDTTLEDLAGNRVGAPFEVDVLRPVQKKIETRTVERPFEVK